MPLSKPLHYNPPMTKPGKSRCGRKLANLKWTTDKNDTTCNSCINLIRKDDKVSAGRG